MTCTRCNSPKIIKDGHDSRGKQRFKCKNCRKKFFSEYQNHVGPSPIIKHPGYRGASCVMLLVDRALAIIDTDDSDLVSSYSWRLNSKRLDSSRYAVTRPSNKTLLMHRLLMRDALASSDLASPQVDHKNRNSLDNRKLNLRVSTQQQNTWNKSHIRGKRYRGISQRSNGRYRVDIRDEYLGDFVNAEDAARAYDARAKTLYGEFACLNFPTAQP